MSHLLPFFISLIIGTFHHYGFPPRLSTYKVLLHTRRLTDVAICINVLLDAVPVRADGTIPSKTPVALAIGPAGKSVGNHDGCTLLLDVHIHFGRSRP